MKRPYIILAVIFILATGCGMQKARPDLKETYSYRDARPFGSKVAYDLLRQIYPGKKVRIVTKNIHVTAESTNTKNSLYFIHARHFFPANMETFSLMNFVNRGNTVFITAAVFDSAFLSNLNLKQPAGFLPFQEMTANYFSNTSVYIFRDSNYSKKEFSYYFRPAAGYFENNSANNFVAGTNKNDQPNLIVINRGKGALIVHCEPRVLSNYFLLKDNNYKYFEEIAGYFPGYPASIFWDNYYNTASINRGKREGDSFAAIMKHPPLKTAFWIAVITLLLFVIFNGKRRQRIIPVLPPNKNASVEFAEAIAGLYLLEKDNISIANKMVQQFHEWVRARMMLNTNNISPDYMFNLARKTNLPEEEIHSFYALVEKLQNSSIFTDEELGRLNNYIEKITRI